MYAMHDADRIRSSVSQTSSAFADCAATKTFWSYHIAAEQPARPAFAYEEARTAA